MFVLFTVTGLAVGMAWAAEVADVPGGTTKSSNVLDGKKFIAETGELGKKASNEDVIVFRDGLFTSEGCITYGFRESPYTATMEADGIRFHAVTVSPTHGTMVWDGIVRGDVLEAKSTWTRDRWYWKIKREYWYRGGPKQ
jgi:hypothetical protein